jgi:hypothetical protein
LSARFSPSPNAFIPNTATMMHNIGKAINHHAWFTYKRPSEIMPPHVAAPDATLKPTKLKIA